MAKKFKFVSPSMMRRHIDKEKSRSSGFSYLILPSNVEVFEAKPDSRVELDFIPYIVQDSQHPDLDREAGIAVKGSLWYRRPYKVHRNIGPYKQTVVCPAAMGHACPICQEREKLIKGGASFRDDVVMALKPIERSLYIVAKPPSSVSGKEVDDVAYMIWDFSSFLFQKHLQTELEEDEERFRFADPTEGMTLRIRFSKESYNGNEYASTSRIDFLPRKYAYSDRVIEEAPCLDTMLLVKSYEELAALLHGVDDEVPRRSDRVSGKASVSLKDELDDEIPHSRSRAKDEEEYEDEEDSSSDDRPVRTRRAPVDEDDEDVPLRAEKPVRTRRAPVDEGKADGKCPFGHQFGKDNDSTPDCDSCSVWSECLDHHLKSKSAEEEA